MVDAAVSLLVCGAIVTILLLLRVTFSDRRIDAAARQDFGAARGGGFNPVRFVTGLVLVVILSYIVLRLGSCFGASFLKGP